MCRTFCRAISIDQVVEDRRVVGVDGLFAGMEGHGGLAAFADGDAAGPRPRPGRRRRPSPRRRRRSGRPGCPSVSGVDEFPDGPGHAGVPAVERYRADAPLPMSHGRSSLSQARVSAFIPIVSQSPDRGGRRRGRIRSSICFHLKHGADGGIDHQQVGADGGGGGRGGGQVEPPRTARTPGRRFARHRPAAQCGVSSTPSVPGLTTSAARRSVAAIRQSMAACSTVTPSRRRARRPAAPARSPCRRRPGPAAAAPPAVGGPARSGPGRRPAAAIHRVRPA